MKISEALKAKIDKDFDAADLHGMDYEAFVAGYIAALIRFGGNKC